jgi:hypothetical protein
MAAHGWPQQHIKLAILSKMVLNQYKKGAWLAKFWA